MQARVKWVEGLSFVGESASGHQVMMDGNSGDKSPSPMEMLLMAIGSCSAADVVSELQQGRHAVLSCEVRLTSQREVRSPRLFTDINLHFIVSGAQLSEPVVAKAIARSLHSHCSVVLMLEKAVKVTHSYEIAAV